MSPVDPTSRSQAGAQGSAPTVEAYLRRLGRRAFFVHAARGAVMAAGSVALAFAAGSIWLGPVGSRYAALAVWALVSGLFAAIVGLSLREVRAFRGARAGRLLAHLASDLPSRIRSAVELQRTQPDNPLVRAHRARLSAQLLDLPPERVVRWRALFQRWAVTAAGALVFGAAVLAISDRAQAGAFRLTHIDLGPAAQETGVVVSSVEAKLIYPSYFERAPVDLTNPRHIEVPVGTTLTLRVRPRTAAASLSMALGAHEVRMDAEEDGRFVGRAVVREDADLRIRVHLAGGREVEDATARDVRVLADQAPTVRLTEPRGDRTVESAAEPVAVGWEATDDVALDAVDLVLQPPGGQQQRKRLLSTPSDPRDRASGTSQLSLSSFGLEPGDRLLFWLEARDGDVISGPNVGRSRAMTVSVASASSRRQQELAGLQTVLERALSALADRLEQPVPAEEGAESRWRSVSDSLEHFESSLGAYMRAAEGRRQLRDPAPLVRMQQAVRRMRRRERAAHRPRIRSLRERQRIDSAVTRELERDALALDARVTRARVRDAAAVAQELEEIRREIRSLLSELRRTRSERARTALLSAVERAQRRLAELMQRVAEMGTAVPMEFMNRQALGQENSRQTLAALQEAVLRNDLDQAERLALELQHEVDGVARALSDTESSYVEARFGPRERAMAEAMDALAGLEGEQHALARREAERRSRASARALDAQRTPRVTERLREAAHEVREALRQMNPGRLRGLEGDAYDRAQQRMQDADDALREGDLGEARQMAEAAARDVAGVARDLQLRRLLGARLDPDRGGAGGAGEQARHASRVEDKLRAFRQRLDDALPDLGSHLSPADRARQTEDLKRQRGVRRAAAGLAERFAEGLEGIPLSPDAASDLGEAVGTMKRAADAMDRSDPANSAALASEAARRLTSLREELESQRRGGGQGGGDGSASNPDFRRPVDIPRAEASAGPMRARRRILDAMQERRPPGFEEQVRRYYEGLLR